MKERRTRKRYQAIFDILDDDNSGSIDADELRESSEVLGISLDHIADNMSESDVLSFEDFVQIVDKIFADERHESDMQSRAMKEGYLYILYERLRRKDGSFTLGCFRKTLAAIGLSLGNEQRRELFDRHLRPQDLEGQATAGGDEEQGTVKKTAGFEEGHSRLISFREYRIVLSAAVLRHDCDYFPMSMYKEAFLLVSDDATETEALGYIPMAHLEDLLFTVGHELHAEELAQIKSDLDRGDGMLLFDNFADVMARFTDTELEEEIVDTLQDKARLLRIELAVAFMRLAKIPLIVIGLVLFSLFTMLIDVYLMAQSFYRNENTLEERVKSYLTAIAAVFGALRPLPLIHLVPPIHLGFSIISLFTLEIEMTNIGVSCNG